MTDQQLAGEGTPGARFRVALRVEKPLQIVGAIHANSALLAQRAGYRAIYLSGGGVASGSLGMPDLGLNTLHDVLIDVQRVTDVCPLPLIVDADTGFGPSALNIARSIKALAKAGAAGCHIEDQVGAKRCGHRPGKEIVSTAEMSDRIKAAADAKANADFFLIARTDAIQAEGVDAALQRAHAYVAAGADGIFVEAALDAATYNRFSRELDVPIMANMTEFGVTPLMELADLGEAGVGMVIYPISAFRAMAKAAELVYRTIRERGNQRALMAQMQTRAELYETIGYHSFEDKLNSLHPEAGTGAGGGS